jgi:phosphoheptose isomerase
MSIQLNSSIDRLVRRYPSLTHCQSMIKDACDALIYCYENGGTLYICGNGGSAADADHIAGELLKNFSLPRPLDAVTASALKETFSDHGTRLAEQLQEGLPAVSLCSHTALLTAVSNDMDADLIFAQQVMVFGKPGDVLLGISTSGNSTNVLQAFRTATVKKMKTIALTGKSGGELTELADILINVPEEKTADAQELHLPVYHCLCEVLEYHFFADQK